MRYRWLMVSIGIHPPFNLSRKLKQGQADCHLNYRKFTTPGRDWCTSTLAALGFGRQFFKECSTRHLVCDVSFCRSLSLDEFVHSCSKTIFWCLLSRILETFFLFTPCTCGRTCTTFRIFFRSTSAVDIVSSCIGNQVSSWWFWTIYCYRRPAESSVQVREFLAPFHSFQLIENRTSGRKETTISYLRSERAD